MRYRVHMSRGYGSVTVQATTVAVAVKRALDGWRDRDSERQHGPSTAGSGDPVKLRQSETLEITVTRLPL